MLATPDQDPVLIDVPVDLPLGVHPGVRRRSHTVEVPPGGMLCLYTDGLVERRDSTIDDDLERLRTALYVGPAEWACAHLMARLVGSKPVEDDIALLVLRRFPASQ